MGKPKHIAILKKGLMFLLLIVLIDLLSGFVFDAMYANSKSGVAYQENQVFNKTKDSILIFGSSRAAFHYRPDLITEQTGLSCYNVGREGMGIYFHYAALLATLERYQPKIIVLDLDFRDVYNRGGSFGEDVFSDLAPFYGKINAEFDSYICRNWYDPLLYQSNLIKYNKKFFNILTANIVKNNDNFKGYIPLKGTWDGKDKVLKGDTFTLSPELINTVHRFIAKAQSHHIEVILVVSPSFKKIKPEFFNIANQIANKHNVKLLNYFDNKDFITNKSLFHDSEHLNEEGAVLFSRQVASQIIPEKR
jgi:hypothetical protein